MGLKGIPVNKPDQPCHGRFPGLSIGMSFLWESYGKYPMGWDSTHLYSISHETVAMS